MDNEGHIRQIGTPYEIFEKPADLFIFKFMGIANFLGVRAENGRFLVGTGNQDVPWEKPQDAAITNWVAAFRPSDVAISRDGEGLRGVIKRANFLGATMDYMIEIDGEHLRTEIVTHEAISENLMFKEGEECVVNFRGFGVAQIILLISIAILVIFVAWPVLLILFNAFFVDGNFNSTDFYNVLTEPETFQALKNDYRQYDCRHVFCVACYPYGFAVQNLYEEPVPCSVHAAELYRRVGVEDAAVA